MGSYKGGEGREGRRASCRVFADLGLVGVLRDEEDDEAARDRISAWC